MKYDDKVKMLGHFMFAALNGLIAADPGRSFENIPDQAGKIARRYAEAAMKEFEEAERSVPRPAPLT